MADNNVEKKKNNDAGMSAVKTHLRPMWKVQRSGYESATVIAHVLTDAAVCVRLASMRQYVNNAIPSE